MRVLAQVEALDGVRVVRLEPDGDLVELAGGPERTDAGALISIDHEAALTRWDVRRLSEGVYRPASLADFLEAPNYEDYVDEVDTHFSAEEVAAFARESGAVLHANVRTDLAYGVPSSTVVPVARRFLLAIGGSALAAVVDELGPEGPLEHLIGLEHALRRSIEAAQRPRAGELAAIAGQLPADSVPAHDSVSWRGWWWRFSRACPDRELARAAARVVSGAVHPEATAQDLAEAERTLRAGAAASSYRWFVRSPAHHSAPPSLHAVDATASDGHFLAFHAVSCAAESLAGAIAAHDRIAHEDARHLAMRRLAELAIAAVTDG